MRKLAIAAAIAATMISTQAFAEFPEKTINYIIPFNAGGESDVSARFQQPFLEALSGQSFVIQYMAGAGGAQAWSQLNGMEGDGYTIMGINLPHTILQPMEKDVGYETKDLTFINFFHYTPNALFVPKDSEFQSLGELVDYAKANPGLVTLSGSGSNSANHLGQVQFDELAGITTTYVPFSGTGPAVTAILGSQTTGGFNYVTSGVNNGDGMRMLAVASEQRVKAFPDVPTFKELGFDIVGGAFRGVAVPSSTPEPIREKISQMVTDVNNNSEFQKKMEDAGFVLTDISYDFINDFVDAKTEEYREIAEKLGIANR